MIKRLGTLLIIFSLTLLTFIYLPLLQAYLPMEDKSVEGDYYINIPKIDAKAKIIDNVDSWKREEYEKALEKGVAKARGFDNFFFAHSSLPPWKMTRTNTPFLRLGELKNGDEIIIRKGGKDYVYIVESKSEVWSNEVGYVLENHLNYLILQTCTPPGTDWKRLLVFAKLT